MTDYLIMPDGVPEHYFFKPYEGICCRSRTPSGLWSDREQIIAGGRDGFCAYADRGGRVHLICVDGENKLIYAQKSGGVWKKYVLSALSEDIFASDMRLYNAGGRLNLLYSALYNGETLLIHCILGDHAKPSTVAAMENSHFFVSGGKAYYTNPQGQLGYTSLADEKPTGFTALYDDAHCCTHANAAGKSFLLFTRESKLFINGSELLYDSRMEMPVFVCGADRLYIMWKSGSFVRYTASFNGGETWSEPMRFMSNGLPAVLFFMQQGESFGFCYGYQKEREITLLGRPAIFDADADFGLAHRGEGSLRAALDLTRRELSAAKRDISRLERALEAMKGE